MEEQMPQIEVSKWIAIGTACLMLFGIFYAQHAQIGSLKKERDDLIKSEQQYSDALEYQNKAILDNMQDANKTKALPIVLHDIKVRYQTVYSTIEKWRESNVTNDCNSSMGFINSFNY